MNDARWFKLLVRAIGLFVLAQSIERLDGVLRLLISLIGNGPRGYGATFAPSNGFERWLSAIAIQDYIYIATGLAQVAFGLYMLFGAPRLARYCVRQVRARCALCDYDIRGLKGACPECGLPIGNEPAPQP